MPTIVVSPANVVSFPEGGGHFWVHLQYVLGFQALGCDVYWLERFRRTDDPDRDRATIQLFLDRVREFGLEARVILYASREASGEDELPCDFLTCSAHHAEALFRRADLLLNSYYAIDPRLLSRFRRTAALDIDPGLLQFWVSNQQIDLPRHDLYFTTGETVGTARAKFSDCGLRWLHIRPPISLPHWPVVFDDRCEVLTTVSGWWGGDGKGEWITDEKNVLFENNKRVTFMQYVELPRKVAQPIELALCLGDGDPPAKEQFQQPGHSWSLHKIHPKDITTYESDARDRAILEHFGWRIRHASDAAGSPARYQSYIQRSRGEFSCAKPSCMFFDNAWVSDRTICYLASGKPAIVQHTGTSEYLPNGEGLFRFSTLAEAISSIEQMNSDYFRHSRAARAIAAAHFDAQLVLTDLLNEGFDRGRRVAQV